MNTKPKTKSKVFEAVHKTASDLHRLGFINKHKMRKFDVLCLDRKELEAGIGNSLRTASK